MFDGTNWPDSNKSELLQWSPNGPSICYYGTKLYLAFRATTGDQIFVCSTSDFGTTLEVQTIPNQATDYTPALTVAGTDLTIAWRSTDPPHRFYAMNTILTSSSSTYDPLTSFGNLVMYGDTSSGSVSMATVDGQPYIAWAGTDSGSSLNVMPLPPYLQSNNI